MKPQRILKYDESWYKGILRLDYETGLIIGCAEDSAWFIIKNLFQLQQRYIVDFPMIGIYRQVPLSYLLKPEEFLILRPDMQKGSIDIFLILEENYRIAVRIQGKKGNLKWHREHLQAELLGFNGIKTVDIERRECKELFREKVNPKSEEEVINCFKTAKVSLPLFDSYNQIKA